MAVARWQKTPSARTGSRFRWPLHRHHTGTAAGRRARKVCHHKQYRLYRPLRDVDHWHSPLPNGTLMAVL